MTKHITEIRHPHYITDQEFWGKWRLIADGGDRFVNRYLYKQPDEDLLSFQRRRENSPAVTFVKSALQEILSAFLARTPNIQRVGGPASYLDACAGRALGITGLGDSIDQFIVLAVLRELLIVRRVGIFVDRPVLGPDTSVAAASILPPYLYTVPVEDILAWRLLPGNLTPVELLLRRHRDVFADQSYLPTGTEVYYQHFQKRPIGPILVTEYSQEQEKLGERELFLPAIPFILLEVDAPVIKDVAGHQIALLNLSSSNLAFALASNLAVYTEQTDMATFMAALRQSTPADDSDADDSEDQPQRDGGPHTIRLGKNRGRRYLQNSERPDFISPSTENLTRSAALVTELKEDIRRLMHLAINNLTTKALTSATAIVQSQAATNNGLAVLGALLAQAERVIALLWGYYEGTEPAIIRYPTDYQLLTDTERYALIEKLLKLREATPSKTYQITVLQQIAHLLLAHRVANTTLTTILREIESAPVLISGVEDISRCVEAAILPRKYAAKALCFPDDSAPLANQEHADRLQRIAESQATTGTARGNSDGPPTAKAEKLISQDPDSSTDGTKGVRG